VQELSFFLLPLSLLFLLRLPAAIVFSGHQRIVLSAISTQPSLPSFLTSFHVRPASVFFSNNHRKALSEGAKVPLFLPGAFYA